MSSPTTTSTRFYPKSLRERLEWVAARQKERCSPGPLYDRSDWEWIQEVSPGDFSSLSLPVLDPNLRVVMPLAWWEGATAENVLIPAPYNEKYR